MPVPSIDERGARVDWTHYWDTDLIVTLELVDPAGAVIDITSFTFAGYIRKTGGSATAFTPTKDVIAGVVKFTIDASALAGLDLTYTTPDPGARYTYRLSYTDAAGSTVEMVYGNLFLATP